MLHELDIALRALVLRDLGDESEITVELDAPTKDWASRRNQPTIDIYLYDIRQDLARSQFGSHAERRDDGSIARRHPHPKFFRVAYLVTAWTQRAEDEHRLLSSLLETFLAHESVPPELLPAGSLADLGIPVPMAVALPPPQDRALSDVWSALGGELKPSLDVSLIAPMKPARSEEAGPPVTRAPLIKMGDREAGHAETHGGAVLVEADATTHEEEEPASSAPASRRRKRA